MAEEHLTTNLEGQETTKGNGKLEPDDYSGDINSQVSQLIAISELLRKLDDAGPGEMRTGVFNGMADIIEGCADRIENMTESTYEYMFQRGKERALEKIAAPPPGQGRREQIDLENLIEVHESGAAVISVTARELEEMAAYMVKFRQDPEFDFDWQAKHFAKGMQQLREMLEILFRKIGISWGNRQGPQGGDAAPSG